MLKPRRIDVEADKATLLEFHCIVNYASASPWVRDVPFEQFREKWLATNQTETYLSALARSMEDKRTIAEIWESDGQAAGYVWATFNDLPDYDLTFEELRDIAVAESYHRRGLASKILSRVEKLARTAGANAIYSDAAWENTASRELHTKSGFRHREIRYEKLLVDNVAQGKSDPRDG